MKKIFAAPIIALTIFMSLATSHAASCVVTSATKTDKSNLPLKYGTLVTKVLGPGFEQGDLQAPIMDARSSEYAEPSAYLSLTLYKNPENKAYGLLLTILADERSGEIQIDSKITLPYEGKFFLKLSEHSNYPDSKRSADTVVIKCKK